MAEFEDKLNSILGNQAAMNQIMALARSLSGGTAAPETPAQPAQEETQKSGEDPEGTGGEGTCVPAVAGQPFPDLSALLGEVDPRMLQVAMKVLREVQSTEDRSTALLAALRPFLREERRARLDRAIQIARMSRMIRAALGALGGKEGETGV